MEHALRCALFQPSGVPQKPGTKSCACFLRLPRQSGSGSQKLDGRTLPGCSAPSALRVPSPSPCPRWSGACALCLATTVRNRRRSSIRNWRPVCSAVGAAVLGGRAYPLPRPPASSDGAGPSVACELFSGLAPSLCSANGRQCVRAG